MSATSPDTQPSRWIAWTLSVLAVPVVYVLTFPLVAFTVMKHSSPGRPPAWMGYYAMPHYRLSTQTPLKDPLKAYHEWWRGILHP